MTLLFILIITLSFIYTLYIQLLSTNSLHAATMANIFIKATGIGAIGCAISFIIYYGKIRALDNVELATAIGDAFSVFIYPACIFTAFVIVLTISVYFTGRKTAVIVPSVCHLASLFVLLYTLICSTWSHYEEFPLNTYIEVLGCCLSYLMMPAASLCMARHAKNLDDKDYVAARKKRYEQKRLKSKEKKRIRETKNRIKNSSKNK